ncbi:MAG TPA: RES family NAD+ phosphorylase [Parafilimonas sp.]|nr:RES family NAD+ phosphorylase [Parafilimonas sp.]
MEVFRLSKEIYKSHLSGKGASIKGARWNSKGIEIIYTAANRSLSMAEVAVHIPLTLAKNYYMLTIYIPDSISILKIKYSDLPEDWNRLPHSDSTKKIGDSFIKEGKYCVLQVPSAVTPGDYNYLINPSHPEFKKISIIDESPFFFDDRLFQERLR